MCQNPRLPTPNSHSYGVPFERLTSLFSAGNLAGGDGKVRFSREARAKANRSSAAKMDRPIVRSAEKSGPDNHTQKRTATEWREAIWQGEYDKRAANS